MSVAKKSPHVSIRVFKSNFMEKFTHVHPILPLLLWMPICIYMLFLGTKTYGFGFFSSLGLFLFGLLFWTFAEYVLHRFLFHYKAVGPFQERLLWLLHGLHHDDPQDPTRLVMPPVLSIALSIPLFSIFSVGFALVKVPHGVIPFFAGFIIGYLCYDYTHYAVHHFNPKTSFGKMVKQNHMLHHFADYESRWGVSSPIWDYVFGTATTSKKPIRQGTYTEVTPEEAANSIFATPLAKPQHKLVPANSASAYKTSEV